MEPTVTVLEAFMESLDAEIGSPAPGPERNRRLRAALSKQLNSGRGSKGARAFLQSMIDNIPDPDALTSGGAA